MKEIKCKDCKVTIGYSPVTIISAQCLDCHSEDRIEAEQKLIKVNEMSSLAVPKHRFNQIEASKKEYSSTVETTVYKVGGTYYVDPSLKHDKDMLALVSYDSPPTNWVAYKYTSSGANGVAYLGNEKKDIKVKMGSIKAGITTIRVYEYMEARVRGNLADQTSHSQ